mmetsp:Transcript_28268/g.70621  ORF Transcript_28268/g.70621 Transcript_28268/m.70621 type:complete len:241 (+) Transcript_28268:1150-1872(+)
MTHLLFDDVFGHFLDDLDGHVDVVGHGDLLHALDGLDLHLGDVLDDRHVDVDGDRLGDLLDHLHHMRHLDDFVFVFDDGDLLDALDRLDHRLGHHTLDGFDFDLGHILVDHLHLGHLDDPFDVLDDGHLHLALDPRVAQLGHLADQLMDLGLGDDLLHVQRHRTLGDDVLVVHVGVHGHLHLNPLCAGLDGAGGSGPSEAYELGLCHLPLTTLLLLSAHGQCVPHTDRFAGGLKGRCQRG